MLFITFSNSRRRTVAFQMLPIVLGWFLQFAGVQDMIVGTLICLRNKCSLIILWCTNNWVRYLSTVIKELAN